MRELLKNLMLRRLALETLRDIREAPENETAYRRACDADREYPGIVVDLWGRYDIQGVRLDIARIQSRKQLKDIMGRTMDLPDELFAPVNWVSSMGQDYPELVIELAHGGGRWPPVFHFKDGITSHIIRGRTKLDFVALFDSIVRDDWRKQRSRADGRLG